MAIGTVAKMFLALNVSILKEGIPKRSFYNLRDLAHFFLTITNLQSLPPSVANDLSSLDSKVSQEIRPSIRKMLQNVKVDKSYFDSANTKL